MIVAVLAMLLALPAATLAGETSGWRIEAEVTGRPTPCVFLVEPVVTVDTIAWMAKCTGKQRSVRVFYSLTVIDPTGAVAQQCSQESRIPRWRTVRVGCTVPNPGHPVG